MNVWAFVKDVGWIGAIGIFFLIAGMALGFDLSPKDFFELSSAVWTPDKKFAVIFAVAGILVVGAALSVARTIPKQSILDSHQKVYSDAARALGHHKALSYKDDPMFVSRVILSAHEFEQQMKDMSNRQDLDEASKDFLGAASRLSKEFYLSVEPMEYIQGINIAKGDVRMNDLPVEAYLDFTAKRLDWVKRTQVLFQGAANMLGIQPPDFNW